jgi:hypothetical protein
MLVHRPLNRICAQPDGFGSGRCLESRRAADGGHPDGRLGREVPLRATVEGRASSARRGRSGYAGLRREPGVGGRSLVGRLDRRRFAALNGASFQSVPVRALLRQASFAAIKPGLRARGISFQSERSLTSVDGVATGAVTGAIATGCSLGSARFAIRAVQPSSGVDPREARAPQASSIWAGCAAGLLHGSARETSAGSRSSAFAVAWSSPKAAHASAAFSRPEWTSRNRFRSGGRDMAIPLSMQN